MTVTATLVSESASLGSVPSRSLRRQPVRTHESRDFLSLSGRHISAQRHEPTAYGHRRTVRCSAATYGLVYDSVHVHRLAADMVTSDYTNESFVDAIKSASSRWDLQDDTKRDAWLLETNAVLKGVC